MLYRLMRALDLCLFFFLFRSLLYSYMLAKIMVRRFWQFNFDMSIHLSELMLCVCVFSLLFGAISNVSVFLCFDRFERWKNCLFFFYFVTSRRSLQIHMMEHPNRLNQEFSDWHICILFNDDNLIVHIFVSFFFFFMRGLTRNKLQSGSMAHNVIAKIELVLFFFSFIHIANEFLFVPVR